MNALWPSKFWSVGYPRRAHPHFRRQWRELDAQLCALTAQLDGLQRQETQLTGLPFGEYSDLSVSEVARATPFDGPRAPGPGA